MKAIFERDALARAVSFLKPAVKDKSIPVLASALISVAGGQASIAVTDTNVWAAYTAKADGDLTSVCVPFWMLDTLTKVGSSEISIEVEEAGIRAASGRTRFTNGIIDATAFPAADPKLDESVSIPGKELAAAIEYCLPFVDTSNINMPWEHGIWLFGSRSEVSALSGHRVLSRRCSISGARDVLIPQLAANLFATIGNMAGDGLVHLRLGETMAALSCDRIEVKSKLIESQHPNWRSAYGEPSDAVAVIDINELTGALGVIDRAIQAGGGQAKSSFVSIAAGDDFLRLSALGAQSDVRAEIVAPFKAISINPRYVRGALAALSGAGCETVSLHPGYAKPCWLSCASHPDLVAAIVSARVPGQEVSP